MGKLIFTLLVIVEITYGFSKEEFVWLYKWQNQLNDVWRAQPDSVRTKYLNVIKDRMAPLAMPVLENNYESKMQLDTLVKQAMQRQKGLSWALDSLKPSCGPANMLSDSLRYEMLYYLYHDNCYEIKKNWNCGGADFYFLDGSGTSEDGWIQSAFVTYWGMETGEIGFSGYLTVAWSRINDSVADSTYSAEMLAKALKEDFLVNKISRPIWGNIVTFKAYNFHQFYKLKAYEILIPVEYDCCIEYPDVFRKLDTMRVIICTKGGFNYLIAYSNESCALRDWVERYLIFNE